MLPNSSDWPWCAHDIRLQAHSQLEAMASYFNVDGSIFIIYGNKSILITNFGM